MLYLWSHLKSAKTCLKSGEIILIQGLFAQFIRHDGSFFPVHLMNYSVKFHGTYVTPNFWSSITLSTKRLEEVSVHVEYNVNLKENWLDRVKIYTQLKSMPCNRCIDENNSVRCWNRVKTSIRPKWCTFPHAFTSFDLWPTKLHDSAEKVHRGTFLQDQGVQMV